MTSTDTGKAFMGEDAESGTCHTGFRPAPSAYRPLTKRTYTNPVPYVDDGKYTAPDPFVIRYRNFYYCYATDEHGVLVSTSPDLVLWTPRGYCYTEEGRKNFWAPSVIIINGVFHMYFSNMPQDESDTHTEIMRVAVSDDPLGPFEKKAELFDTFAIDSQVVRGDDGQLYLLYADNQVCGLSELRPGTSVMVDRMVTPYQREGKPRPLILPTMDEEIFARDRFGDGRDWHTVEGATYFTYRDKAFITYSANAYEHEDYFVGYSTASLPDSPIDAHVDELDWAKQLNNGHFDPLLIRSDTVEGTGHNSIVKAPNGVDDWIVYHGRDAADELYVGVEQRVMRMDPLYYAEGLLDTPGPSSDERDAPLEADVHSDFSAGVPNDWKTVSGSAHVVKVDGQPAIGFDGGGFMASAPLVSATQTLVVWVKCGAGPLGSRAGLVVRFSDGRNWTYAMLDAGTHCLRVIDSVSGIVTRTDTPLPVDLDLSSWHELAVSRVFDRMETRIDGRGICTVAICPEPGACGIVSMDGDAVLSSFTAVDHADLWGPTLRYMVREIDVSDSFRLTDAGLEPLDIGPAFATLRHPLEGNRYVLDFAFAGDQSEALITIGEYRVALEPDRVELLRGGNPVGCHAEPVRLRALHGGTRRDMDGRALRTIRLMAADGVLAVHARDCGWRLPFDGGRIGITLNRASLTGYARTSLGLSDGGATVRLWKGE